MPREVGRRVHPGRLQHQRLTIDDRGDRVSRGGEAGGTIKAPGRTEHHPIILERRLSEDLAFEEWANALQTTEVGGVSEPGNFRKEVVIELYDDQGNLLRSWLVHRCWVSEYAVTHEFDANATPVAIEIVTLEHEGWERGS